ncbi:MAG: hypothetical protein HA495_00400 [Thaumarchaeota archaeon]|nr:hypothetical protein [Nitrososphaerota archaeon]
MKIYKAYRCKFCKRLLYPVVDTGKVIVRKGKKYKVTSVECPFHGVQYHWEKTEVS